MAHFHYKWRSFQGAIMADNRDYCGIGQKDGAVLYVVIDGASSGRSGGELAENLAHGFWIPITDSGNPEKVIQ